ncbi:MAG: hypothetical protein DSZ05_09090 [Sulfurospirillum sp.]|nr:MAG: hypothetical protein DSZ05_09090 [Sulfurospirillum sp.]
MDEKRNEDIEKKEQSETTKPRRRTRKSTGRDSAQSKEQKAERKEEQELTSSDSDSKSAILEESVAYLKEIGLKKVSNKTFINEADLAAFLDEDFTNINKTRALGFIQILEREYPVKLDDLKNAYLTYAQQNKQEKRELVVQPKIEEKNSWKKYIVLGVPALLLLVAGWYFMTRDTSESGAFDPERQVTSPDINTDVVIEAEKNLTDYETQKVDFSQDEEIIDSPRVSPLHRTDAATKEGASMERTVDKNSESAIKNDDLDLDQMVKQMVQEYNLTLEDTNTTTTTTATTTVQTEENKTQIRPSESTVAVAATVPSPVSAVTEHAIEKKEKVAKKSTIRKSVVPKIDPVVVKERKKSPPKVIKSKLYIVPHRKSWVGIIYLDDYSKKDFLIRNLLRLNSTRPQLIVVGQKEFEIYNDGYSYRFRGKGPVRFIYKDGDIMEITNSEFKEYSKGITW